MIGAKVIEFESESLLKGNNRETVIVNRLILEKDNKKYSVYIENLDQEHKECVIEEIT